MAASVWETALPKRSSCKLPKSLPAWVPCCCPPASHSSVLVVDPSDSDEYALFVTHGYHNRGAPSWFDDTWVFWSKQKVWRKLEGNVESGPAPEPSPLRPGARYGSALGTAMDACGAGG